MVAMLNNAAYTENVGKRLHAVAAELGRLAGWLAYDSEQPAIAQRYFLAALLAAHVSGDRAIGANVLGCMSIQAEQSSSPGDAVTLVESALRAQRELTPTVAGSLYGRLAGACATATEGSSHHPPAELSPHPTQTGRLPDSRHPYARAAAVREFDAKHRDLHGTSLT